MKNDAQKYLQTNDRQRHPRFTKITIFFYFCPGHHTRPSLIHTYHSRFLPEGVAEVSQIFLRNTHVLPKYLVMRNTADVTGGKPIAVLLQSISGVSAINPLVAFYDVHGRKKRCYSFFFVSDHTRQSLLIIKKTHKYHYALTLYSRRKG
jgi:hypothetical protein